MLKKVFKMSKINMFKLQWTFNLNMPKLMKEQYVTQGRTDGRILIIENI